MRSFMLLMKVFTVQTYFMVIKQTIALHLSIHLYPPRLTFGVPLAQDTWLSFNLKWWFTNAVLCLGVGCCLSSLIIHLVQIKTLWGTVCDCVSVYVYILCSYSFLMKARSGLKKKSQHLIFFFFLHWIETSYTERQTPLR